MKKEHDFSEGVRGAVVPNKIKPEWIMDWFIENFNMTWFLKEYDTYPEKINSLTDFLNEKLKSKKEG